MTLIAGFKSDEGYVLCADSQETVAIGTGKSKAEYRVTCQKIVPERFGNFELAIAGSGTGEVIDGFIQRLRDNMQGLQVSSLNSLKEYLQHELRDFQRTEVAAYPASARRFALIIAARSCDDNSCMMWFSNVARLTGIYTCKLIGHEDARYVDAMESLYPNAGATIAQCILLGLYPNYVGNPINVVVIKGSGSYLQDAERVTRLQQRVTLFHAQFDNIFLACADTGLQPDIFKAKIKEFLETIATLRRDSVEEWAGEAAEKGFDKMIEQWADAPAGTLVIPLAMTPEQQRGVMEQQKRLAESLQQNFGHVQEPERIVSNLKAARIVLAKSLGAYMPAAAPPTVEEQQNYGLAHAELMQAAMMGPYKVNPDVVALLNQVVSVLQSTAEDVSGYPDSSRRDVVHLLRFAVVEHALITLCSGHEPATVTPPDTGSPSGENANEGEA